MKMFFLNSKKYAGDTSVGSLELGEAFTAEIFDMVTVSGDVNKNAVPFEILPSSWKKRVDAENKTAEDKIKLEEEFWTELNAIAASFLLFIMKETKATEPKIRYEQYEAFMLKHRFGKDKSRINIPAYLKECKAQIKCAFDKISSQGGHIQKDYIDYDDLRSFIYVLMMEEILDENQNLKSYKVNGVIHPVFYTVNEAMMFSSDSNNYFGFKQDFLYRIFNDKWEN